MLASDDDDLIPIEFETTLDSSVAAPDSVSAGGRSAALPMAMVVLAVGGLLVALVWFSSATDSTAEPEDLPADDASLSEDEDETSSEEPVVEEPETDSVIPDLSSASIALEPLPLEDPSFATFFDGGLFALADGSIADELVTPTVLRSLDGVDWERVPTQAAVSGVPNVVGYSWSDIRRAGEGLVATAVDFDRTRVSFISSNGLDWEQISTEDTRDAGKIFFEPLTVADDYLVGLSLGASQDLARFVEEHTTAVDVGEVCFVDSRAAIGCDQLTEWPFTEETIDSPAGSEAVFSCLNLLSVIGPDISLSRLGRLGSSVEPIDFRIYLTQSLPVALDDGRIAGVDALSFFGDPDACDGLAEIDEIDPDPFYIFDPVTGDIERAALPPELNPASTELLGKTSVAGSESYLFRSNGRLWLLNFATSEWMMVDGALFGEQVVLADSGDRLYSFGGGDLNVVDLVATGQGVEIIETAVYVVLPTDWTFSFIQSAGAEDVIFQTDGSSWLLHVPSGLRCAEQYAEALAGNGLVEDC